MVSSVSSDIDNNNILIQCLYKVYNTLIWKYVCLSLITTQDEYPYASWIYEPYNYVRS